MTKVKVTIEGGRALVADLVDNQATQALVGRLPLTITMDNLYGREMCHRFGPRPRRPATKWATFHTGHQWGAWSFYTNKTARSLNNSRWVILKATLAS